MKPNKLATFLIVAVGLLVLPLLLQQGGNAWVRIVDMALLYVMLALGLNIVVGYAGLLDLGYVAFFAVGAYLFALLGSPHLAEAFPWIAAAFPEGLHLPIWAIIPLAAALAGVFGVLLGAVAALVAIWLAPSPPPLVRGDAVVPLTAEGRACLGIMAFAVTLWVTETVPFAVTSLLVVILIPMLGLADFRVGTRTDRVLLGVLAVGSFTVNQWLGW